MLQNLNKCTNLKLHETRVLINDTLKSLVNSNQYKTALNLFANTPERKTVNSFGYNSLFKACGSLADVRLGSTLHGVVLRNGFASHCFVGNGLIPMYGTFGFVRDAEKAFEGMCVRTVVSWNVMIGVFEKCGRGADGFRLFRRMVSEGKVKASRATVLSVMGCVVNEDEADMVYRVAVDKGVDDDCRVISKGVLMYARCGRIDVARRLFDGVVEKDLVCWSSMIEGYVQAGLSVEGFEVFRRMVVGGVFPDFVTVLSVVRGCANIGSFQLACLLHGFVIRCVFERSTALETSLVDLYVKCGSLAYARKVFDGMQERNVISWSTMISGYGSHGHGREAVGLFYQMKSLIKPDNIIFVSVLSACSHNELIAEGWELFSSMERDFGITPQPEHYACIVDLLGRAGQLNEARDFIDRMPISPTAGVWGALLGACRIHRNVEMAEVVEKCLLDLDATNAGRYVLLSNIYASSGKEHEVHRIRALMKHRRVKKNVGFAQV